MGQASQGRKLGLALAALLLGANSLGSEEKPREPQFKYAGGTESLRSGCMGNLELTAEGLTFNCPGGAINAPFSSIRLMEYRSDVSRKVWRMKLKWKVRPTYEFPLLGGNKNRFFTVVFRRGGATRAIVLQVSPEAMRPYLAEIDLKAGRRVDVQGYEDY